MAQLRQQLAASRAEAAALRRSVEALEAGNAGCGSGGMTDMAEALRGALEEMQAKATVLEVENVRLTRELVRSGRLLAAVKTCHAASRSSLR